MNEKVLPFRRSSFPINKIVVGMLPFTPVPFRGPSLMIAAGRIAGYSLLSYVTYQKMRPASYAFMAAAALSLATSLTADLWTRQEVKP